MDHRLARLVQNMSRISRIEVDIDEFIYIQSRRTVFFILTRIEQFGASPFFDYINHEIRIHRKCKSELTVHQNDEILSSHKQVILNSF